MSNRWIGRALIGALFCICIFVHRIFASSLSDSEFDGFIFYISAAATDLLLIYSVPSLSNGRLCDDIQTTCLVSIFVNFLGWIAFMAYAPPFSYNLVSWWVTYVQCGRLLLVDDDDADHLGVHLVQRCIDRWSQINSRKTFV